MFKKLGKLVKGFATAQPNPSNTLPNTGGGPVRITDKTNGVQTQQLPNVSGVFNERHSGQVGATYDFSCIPNTERYSWLSNFIFANMRRIEHCTARRHGQGVSGKVEGVSHDSRGNTYVLRFEFDTDETVGKFSIVGGFSIEGYADREYIHLTSSLYAVSEIVSVINNLMSILPKKSD